MRKLLLLGVLCLWPLRPAAAWNPVTDVRENLQWTLGSTAQVGTAIKLWGAGDLNAGDSAASVMFGVFDYRFMSASYGVITDRNSGNRLGDGFKLGLKVSDFLGWFKNPPTPAMSFLQNVNIGPVYSVPVLTSPHGGILWVEANYTFGK